MCTQYVDKEICRVDRYEARFNIKRAKAEAVVYEGRGGEGGDERGFYRRVELV